MIESRYLLRAPDPRVRGLLDRDYLTFAQPATAHDRWLATPGTTVTLIVNLDNAFGGYPRAFVAGLTDTHGIVDQAGAIHCLDLKLTPLGAYTLLGVPMHELVNRVVDLTDILPGARDLADRLAGNPAGRFNLLDAFLLDAAGRGPRPAPEVAWALRVLTGTHGAVSVGALAEEIGWSRRHLVAKFRQQVGLPPKTMARIIRFGHLLRRVRTAGPARWIQLAAECGYYDQAHMNRDFREFAGTTPTEFRARLVTSVQYSWVPAA